MENETYNGWTNYATWRVNLEWGFCDYSEEYHEYSPEELKEYVEEAMLQDVLAENSMVYSYALAFLNDVNWHEIHRHIQENVEHIS